MTKEELVELINLKSKEIPSLLFQSAIGDIDDYEHNNKEYKEYDKAIDRFRTILYEIRDAVNATTGEYIKPIQELLLTERDRER